MMEGEYGLIEGQDGGTVEVRGHPLAAAPGVAFAVGRSDRFRFSDHGIEVNVAGRNAFSAPFAYRP